MSVSPLIMFGDVTFDQKDIQSFTLTEDFSPFSITVPIGELDLVIHSTNLDFSIVNPSGVFAPLLAREPVLAYVVVDGKKTLLGQYYLDTWDNPSDDQIHLVFIDNFGLLDSQEFLGGIWLTPTTVGALLADVFRGLGVGYEVDPDLAAATLTGWIPIGSYREAIQQICFAAGAYAVCARQNGFIKFGRLEPAVSKTSGIRCGVGQTGTGRMRQLKWRRTQWFVFATSLNVTRGVVSGVANAGQSRIWQKHWRPSQWGQLDPTIFISDEEQLFSRKLTLRQRVTGVEVTQHDIVTGDGSQNLYEGELAVGQHLIRFAQPMHSLSVVGATVTFSGANHALLNVAEAGEVLLSGKVYEDVTSIVGIYDNLPAGTKENIIAVSDASLVNSANGRYVARRLFDYYQERYMQQATLIEPKTKPGGVVIIDTLYGRQLTGVVEHLSIDVAGGYLADAEIIGIVD